jgi:SAM-dependent methyltransferase
MSLREGPARRVWFRLRNAWRRFWPGQPWEREGLRAHLICLVGHEFGERPERRLEEIRADKARMAELLIEQARLQPDSRVIEIGSGMGFISAHLASRVGHLHCTDVSSSFLGYARQACAGHRNVSFHQLHDSSLSFCRDAGVDAVVSHAVFLHLDLFAIYWYLAEASRVLRSGGVMLFEINSLAALDLEHEYRFHNMARQARGAPPSLRTELMLWNCPETVRKMAYHHGLVGDPLGSEGTRPQPEVFRFRKP